MTTITPKISAYYRIVYVYYITNEQVPRIANVAINKAHAPKTFDQLLANEPFFKDLAIEGFSIEKIVDYTEIDTCQVII